MIVGAFITFITYILSGIVSLLPVSAGFPSDVSSSVVTMAGYVAILNVLLPIPTLATVVGIVIAAELAIFTFKTFKWLISHLPFVGGKG